VALSAPLLRVPLGASDPLQPPAALHAVACVELQESADAPPAATVVGFAISVAVGGRLTAIVTVAA